MMLVGERSLIIFSIGNVPPGTLVGAKYFFTNVFRMCSFDLFFDIMVFVFFFLREMMVTQGGLATLFNRSIILSISFKILFHYMSSWITGMFCSDPGICRLGMLSTMYSTVSVMMQKAVRYIISCFKA